MGGDGDTDAGLLVAGGHILNTVNGDLHDLPPYLPP